MNKPDPIHDIAERFRGRFLTPPEQVREKLFRIKAYIFDWDGVFNSGFKDEDGSSPFSEVDSMGTNMLRLNHYLRTGSLPVTAILSGERNKAAFTLARRERFHAAYYSIRNKTTALSHICDTWRIRPEEVAFVFDDILDLSIADQCGLRVMVQRPCNPLLIDFAEKRQLADYITGLDGAHHAVRETAEMLCGISGKYDETISHRIAFSKTYRQYLSLRDGTETSFFCRDESENIIQKEPS